MSKSLDSVDWFSKLDPETAEWVVASRSPHTGVVSTFKNGGLLLCVMRSADGRPTYEVNMAATVLWRLVSSSRRLPLRINAHFRDKRIRFSELEDQVKDGLLSNMELAAPPAHPERRTLFPDSRTRRVIVQSDGVDELSTAVATGGWPDLRLGCEASGSGAAGLSLQRGTASVPPLNEMDTLEVGAERSPKLSDGSLLRRVFLIYCTEWDSGNGGLSTFNRMLCLSLAELGHDVYLSTPAGNTDIRFSGPRVLKLQGDGDRWAPSDTSVALGSISPDFVVGHDRITGAEMLRDGAHFIPDAIRVLFVHTDPRIEAYGDSDDATAGKKLAEKQRVQDDLMRQAHKVVAVGPRLFRHADARIQGFQERPLLVRIDPGFAQRQEALPKNQDAEFRLLLIARSNDVRLKGRQVAVDAVRIARAAMRASTLLLPSTNRLHLGICGVSEDEIAKLSREVGPDARISPYSVSRAEIGEEFRRVHLVLVPSHEEGFGLVALEALEANRPVLATSNSGFAEYLLERCSSAPVSQYAASMIVEEDRVSKKLGRSELWAQRIVESINSYDELVRGVDLVRANLCNCSWEESAREFVRAISPSKSLSAPD